MRIPNFDIIGKVSKSIIIYYLIVVYQSVSFIILFQRDYSSNKTYIALANDYNKKHKIIGIT